MRKASTTRVSPLGPIIVNGSVLSAFPHCKKQSRKPADMVCMKMCHAQYINRFKTGKLRPLCIAICVPSPLSIKRLLPLYRSISDVSHRFGSGIMPAVPNKQTSNINFSSYSFSYPLSVPFHNICIFLRKLIKVFSNAQFHKAFVFI